VADTTHSDQTTRGSMIPGERDPSTLTQSEREDARGGDQRPGSKTGTIGGGSADEATAAPAKTARKRTTKKYER
jgi:hypothetical protein